MLRFKNLGFNIHNTMNALFYQNKAHTHFLQPEIMGDEVSADFCDRICYRCSASNICELRKTELEATKENPDTIDPAETRIQDCLNILPDKIFFLLHEDEEELFKTTGIGCPLIGKDLLHPLLSAATWFASTILENLLEAKTLILNHLYSLTDEAAIEKWVLTLEVCCTYPGLCRNRIGDALYHKLYEGIQEDADSSYCAPYVENIFKMLIFLSKKLKEIYSANILNKDQIEFLMDYEDFTFQLLKKNFGNTYDFPRQ